MAEPTIEPTQAVELETKPTAGAVPQPSAQSAPPVEPVTQTVFDAEYVKSLRDEAAEWRVKHKTEAQKATELATQLEIYKVSTNTANLRAAIMTAETKVVDIQTAIDLMDKSKLKYNDDGTVEGVDEALMALLEAKPFMKFNPAQSSAPANNPARSGAKFTREQIEKMSPAEINANWADIQQVLSSKQ